MIYRRDQDPFARAATASGGMRAMMTSHLFAPDVVEAGGKYYLYYGIGLSQSGMAMAVGDSPVGPFEYVGRVRYPDSAKPAGWRDGRDGLDDGDMAFFGGRAVLSLRGITLKEYPYDPASLLHDGRLFLYFGLMNCYVVELDMTDMRTVVPNSKGGYATQIFRGGLLGMAREALEKSPTDAHFVNGPSIREIDGTFVLSYYAAGPGGFNGMYYATADRPEGPFTPRGPLVSLGNARFRGQQAPTTTWATPTAACSTSATSGTRSTIATPRPGVPPVPSRSSAPPTVASSTRSTPRWDSARRPSMRSTGGRPTWPATSPTAREPAARATSAIVQRAYDNPRANCRW